MNADAHEPLTDPKTFEDAQQAKGRGGRTGEIADQAICRGFLKCGSCGHTLVVTGASSKDAESGQPMRKPVYYCSRLYASGECPQPASITAAKIDPFIEEHFLGLLANPVEFFHLPRASRLPELQAKPDFANRERSDLVRKMTLLIEAVGETEFDTQLSEKIAEARPLDAEIEQERLQMEVRAGIDTGTLLRDWRDFTRPEKNEAMRLVYESVKVLPTSGNKRGRWAPPAEERVAAIVIRPEL